MKTIVVVLLASLLVVLIIVATASLTIVIYSRLPQNGSSSSEVQSTPNCNRSVTTASGKYAKKGPFCVGDLIFEDNFNKLNTSIWENENSLAGGGNWEFQWYTKDRENSFASNGSLHIKPTLTADFLGVDGGSRLATETIAIPANECTWNLFEGCERTGTSLHYINPIRSARVHTIHSFAFKYGRVEIRAKIATGDWLRSSLWLLAKESVYGIWPRSGHINMLDARGNFERVEDEPPFQQSGTLVCYGPNSFVNACKGARFNQKYPGGFNDTFRRYQMEWTPAHIKLSIDDEQLELIEAGDGFWDRGGFGGRGTTNPWDKATLMAPFDQEFFLIINLAVGGTLGYFPDNADKPWVDRSQTASRDFWNARSTWYPTWKPEAGSTSSSLLVDYVRVWAV